MAATTAQPGAVPDKCVWLVIEGQRLEAKAVELEQGGKSAEAAFQHKVAAGKLQEAGTLCPMGHPDMALLESYGEELKSRAVYLESLGQAPISLPLEDFVGDLEITMDLSKAQKPPEETISTLLAKGGASGASSALTEEGYQLVLALRSNAEMRIYIDRLLQAEGRRRSAGAGTDAQQDELVGASSTLETLKAALRRAPWVELDIDPKMDKLDLAMKFEKEAHSQESAGDTAGAIDTYNRALAVLQYVHKHDPRTKNAKIKEMIGKRLQELVNKITSLGGTPVTA